MKLTPLSERFNEGENLSRSLSVEVEEEYSKHTVILVFNTPKGFSYTSDAVLLSDGVGTYNLPACVLDAPGTLRCQIVVYGDEDFLAKSKIYEFTVSEALSEENINENDESVLTLGILVGRINDYLEEIDTYIEDKTVECVNSNVADFVVERGTTQKNCYYRKWNSGTVECWGVVAVNISSISRISDVISSALCTYSVPSVIKSIQTILATPVHYHSIGVRALFYSNTSEMTFSVYGLTSEMSSMAQGDTLRINICIKGSWK